MHQPESSHHPDPDQPEVQHGEIDEDISEPQPEDEPLEAVQEEEVATSGLRRIFRKATDAYFRPHSLESEKLYEAIGIRIFKKYVPTSGDLMVRTLRKTLPDKFGDHTAFNTGGYSPNSSEGLKSFDHTTRMLEAVHLAIIPVFEVAGAAISHYTGDPKGLAVLTALQLPVNIYPIMLQRYNRLRTWRIRAMIERRDTTGNE